jgi:DNA-directed RNA polymerase specialized sigma24 family protein
VYDNSAACRIDPASSLSSPPKFAGQAWPETDHSALQKLRGGTAAEQEAALRQLFLTYAVPIRRYIRHHWPLLAEADIDDFASEFATHCLTGEKAHFLTYDPGRDGAHVRLRTYLCRILDNFLRSQHRRSHALTRGGGRRFETLDTTHPAAHQEFTVVCQPPPGVDIDSYDRHWAQHVLTLAFQALEHAPPATRAVLPVLRPWILADPGESTLKEIALGLGRTHAALRAQLHRLRKAWRQAVRDAVARTVSHPDEIDGELRHLAAVLARHGSE